MDGQEDEDAHTMTSLLVDMARNDIVSQCGISL
jgi:hypothetical protein